jgi:hypothetical protein
MEIRFISSLTPEDENTFAPALLTALANLLDCFPIAYTIRIQTSGAKIFQRHHSALARSPETPASLPLDARSIQGTLPDVVSGDGKPQVT